MPHPCIQFFLIWLDNLALNYFFLSVGGFQIVQLIEGKVALFNMWDYELNSDQVMAIYCTLEGNLLTMIDMSIKGPAMFTEESIQNIMGV